MIRESGLLWERLYPILNGMASSISDNTLLKPTSVSDCLIPERFGFGLKLTTSLAISALDFD